MPSLKDAVNHWATEDDSAEMTSRIVNFPTSSKQVETMHSEVELTRETISITGEEIEVFVGEQLTTQEWNQVEEFVQSYTPRHKQCFANAIEFAVFNDNVCAVNGVTKSIQSDCVYDHAWNMLNGKIVDVTRNHAEQYGVKMESKKVRELYNTLESGQNWSFLLNNSTYHNLRSD